MRPFSLKHHPDNVAVFNASSMIDALLLADNAHRKGAHAGIWVNPKEAMESPYKNDKAIEEQASRHTELAPHLQRSRELAKQFSKQSYKMRAHGLDAKIEQRRFAGLMSLRIVFREVVPEGRVQSFADYAPHLDPDPAPDIPAQPENLFQGKHVKILCIQHGDGMLGFDERDRKRFETMGSDEFTRAVHPKWYMNPGDIAFFQGRFLHSAAKFQLRDDQVPRVADIQDCSRGIPLNLVRKLT